MTEPPETSVTELRGPCGWTTAAEGLRILQAETQKTGLKPDWSHPVDLPDKDGVKRTWEDPDPGLNGMAIMTLRKDGGVCSLTQSMAL